jgi:hypothetical protein
MDKSTQKIAATTLVQLYCAADAEHVIIAWFGCDTIENHRYLNAKGGITD